MNLITRVVATVGCVAIAYVCRGQSAAPTDSSTSTGSTTVVASVSPGIVIPPFRPPALSAFKPPELF